MKPQNSNRPKQPAFKQATDLLARTAAIGVTFFVTGPLYAATDGSVRSFVSGAYASELTGIASLAWFAIVGVSVFAFATLTIAAVVQVGSAKLAQLSLNRK